MVYSLSKKRLNHLFVCVHTCTPGGQKRAWALRSLNLEASNPPVVVLPSFPFGLGL